MSRIGKKMIEMPEKVSAAVTDSLVTLKGPLGQLTVSVPILIKVLQANGSLAVERSDDSKEARSCHGLVQRLLANAVKGVAEGFSKTLEINGVGYRADVKGKTLNLSLGFSHPVVFPIPDGLEIKVNKQTELIIKGADKQLVGEVAAKIRQLRPPEPYKGKGIKYADEVIQRKAGKAAA
jgi:large subunit ribosomal protein L6